VVETSWSNIAVAGFEYGCHILHPNRLRKCLPEWIKFAVTLFVKQKPCRKVTNAATILQKLRHYEYKID